MKNYPSLSCYLQKYAHISIGAVLGIFLIGTVYAMVTIPPTCSTPGDCDDVSPAFQSATLEGDLQLADADASNTVSLSAPAVVTADVVFNLPGADGTTGQELRTDGAGNLSFTQVSKRVGEMIFAKTSATKTAANGYLAVTPGTVTNGAIDYPVWASMYPEFVVGNNIVFPADVAGIFIRNLGGSAGAEGSLQADATAAPNSAFTTNSAGSHAHTIPGYASDDLSASGSSGDWVLFNADGAFSSAVRSTNVDGAHTHTISGGDSETRPVNRAYQLYTIVDTY